MAKILEISGMMIVLVVAGSISASSAPHTRKPLEAKGEGPDRCIGSMRSTVT